AGLCFCAGATTCTASSREPLGFIVVLLGGRIMSVSPTTANGPAPAPLPPVLSGRTRMPAPTGQPTPRAAAKNRLSRRSFLKVGTLGFGWLTLPQLLKAEAAAGIRSSPKSVIFIYLVG